MLKHFLARVNEKANTPAAAPVLIVALGDSVTQGCMKAGVIDHQGVYHNVLKKLLERQFPATTFSVINAGVCGESASGGRKRLERDVIRHNPDLLLLGFCLNDSCGGLTQLASYRNNLRAIIQKTRAKTRADVIALTPNFMASAKNPRIAAEHRKYTKNILAAQKDGTLKAFAAELRQTAAALAVPVADVYAQWEQMAAKGLDTTAMLCNGLNHPDPARQRLIAKTIMSLILRAHREV